MITIIAVGKIKEQFLVDGINEYLKRLEAYENIKLIEVKEVNNKEINENIKREGTNILEKISSSEFVITLEIEGKQLDSVSFADKISKLQTYGNSHITFVIGGSNGLSDEVKKRSNFKLSFSKFTFPHQLMRLILMEQIYRAYTIINHKEYHK